MLQPYPVNMTRTTNIMRLTGGLADSCYEARDRARPMPMAKTTARTIIVPV